MYSLLLLAVILAVVYIFYKFVISPMRDHFQQEKIDLRSKHTQLMAAFAEMDPDPIFRFDEDGKVVMANQAGNELLKNDFVIGKKLENFIPEIKQVDIKGCIREGLQLDVGAPIGDKYFRFTLTGLPGMGIGQIYGSDITELKETENKLIDAAKKAEDSEKIKSYFLAQMSHEIRSPLTAVLGFNAIIKEELQGQGSITEDLSYAFNAVEVSGKRLTRTIDQLLNMAQLQTNTYEVRNEKFNVQDLLKNVIDEYFEESQGKGIELNFENKADDHILESDKNAARQIFVHLVDNAIKYTQNGTVRVLLDRNKDGRLYVAVSDTGIGMSEDYMKQIFTPFTQEVMGYNRRFEGNGLGLALCKKYSNLINAEIKVSSVKDEGSIFTVQFKDKERS